MTYKLERMSGVLEPLREGHQPSGWACVGRELEQDDENQFISYGDLWSNIFEQIVCVLRWLSLPFSVWLFIGFENFKEPQQHCKCTNFNY